jgi:hypothetical protein
MNLPDGLYEARSTDPNGTFRLDLRVDFGRPDRLGKKLLSADLYSRQGNQETFDATFCSTRFTPNADQTVFQVDASVVGSSRTALFTFTQPDDASPLTLSFQEAQGAPVAFTLRRLGDALRAFNFQYDVQDGMAPDFRTVFPPVAVAWRGRRVDFDSCFRDAGISLSAATRPTSAVSSNVVWDTGTLQHLLNDDFSLNVPGEVSPSYLFIANQYADARVLGIMFDLSKRFGSAVFYSTLQTAFPNTFNENYLRTVVHEVGHVFNLKHSFEPGTFAQEGDAALSFMNYPFLYTGFGVGRSPEDRYWSAFDFQFAGGELEFLCHGPRDQVFTGARYLGNDPQDPREGRDLLRQPGPQRGSPTDLQFSLRLRPLRRGNLFRFGEPVHFEAELANVGNRRVTVQRSLQPTTAITRYIVQKPNGKIVGFEPPFACCQKRDDLLLSPGRSFHNEICLAFGNEGGFVFMEPGRYRVQGIYKGAGAPLYSNVLSLWVRYPTSEEEDLVVPTFDERVATYLSVGGHPAMVEAINILDDFVDRAGGAGGDELPAKIHPLVYQYDRCRAHRCTEPQFTFRRRGRRRTAVPTESNPENYRLFRKTLGLNAEYRLRPESLESGVPLSNLGYGSLAQELIDSLRDERREREANTVAAAVRTYLNQRNHKPGARKGAQSMAAKAFNRARTNAAARTRRGLEPLAPDDRYWV